ncbi:MAG: hypothetical protein ABH891_10150 [Candidatus Omnitrophota bacterium]
MMKKMMLFPFLAVAVFLSATAPAHAWDSQGKQCPLKTDEGQSQCPIADKFMKKAAFLLENKAEMGLTDEQVASIKRIKLQVEKNSIRQCADMKTFLLDLKSKLSEDKVDIDGTNRLIDDKFVAAIAAAKSNVTSYAELKTLLSVEQLKKMKELHGQTEKKKKAEGEEEEQVG